MGVVCLVGSGGGVVMEALCWMIRCDVVVAVLGCVVEWVELLAKAAVTCFICGSDFALVWLAWVRGSRVCVL